MKGCNDKSLDAAGGWYTVNVVPDQMFRQFFQLHFAAAWSAPLEMSLKSSFYISFKKTINRTAGMLPNLVAIHGDTLKIRKTTVIDFRASRP